MLQKLVCGLIPLLIVAGGCEIQTQQTVTYTVATYDPTRDPAADLKASVEQAQASGKRILLQVGGDWCSWCHRLDAYIEGQPVVTDAIGKNFVVMKVNRSDENENADFLSHYPEIPGYPHWFVLDTDGKLLHSQDTAILEAGVTYSQPAILMFVDQWKVGGTGA